MQAEEGMRSINQTLKLFCFSCCFCAQINNLLCMFFFLLVALVVWFLPGDHVAACDVSNRSCEERHDNPREEWVLHFTGREWGQSFYQPKHICCVASACIPCSSFIWFKFFSIFTFLPETQDPVVAAQGPTGGKSLIRNLFRITLSFYSSMIVLLTGSFVLTFFACLGCRISWINCAQTLFWTWIWRKAV